VLTRAAQRTLVSPTALARECRRRRFGLQLS
jgi:hypothetical protein